MFMEKKLHLVRFRHLLILCFVGFGLLMCWYNMVCPMCNYAKSVHYKNNVPNSDIVELKYYGMFCYYHNKTTHNF